MNSLASDGLAKPGKWSKDVLEAIEAHLGLLQKQQCQHYRQTEVIKQEQSNSKGGLSSIYSEDDDDGYRQALQERDLGELLSCRGGSLPDGWEQHLDLRTGEIYYIHWRSCKMSKDDPRKVLQSANKRICDLIHHHSHGLSASPTEQEGGERSPSECITVEELISVEKGTEAQSKPTCPGTPSQPPSQLQGSTSSIHAVCEGLPLSIPHESSSLSCPKDFKGPHRTSEMQVIGCRYCLSYVVAHRANPWCSQCGHPIV